MIVFVPISPEVPKYHAPRLWQGLVLVLILSICYLFTESLVIRDSKYLQGVYKLAESQSRGKNLDQYLSLRPLLEVAPSRSNLDLEKLIRGNFIHGSHAHLALNLIGVFAGARICATFLPFYWVAFLFIVGGSIGLWVSILLAFNASPYIPHVGASAGIFTLMGAYYIYNFRFRTRYFYWFPDHRGRIALPTSWFFFFDVLLLELVLSAAQLSPTKFDTVDHVAHVVGFLAGCLGALALRFLQRWPTFIHTRAELVFWRSMDKPLHLDPLMGRFARWIRCLEINPYNDLIKIKLIHLVKKHLDRFDGAQLEMTFRFLTPVFCRRQPKEMALLLKTLLEDKRGVPQPWLQQTPYDVIIHLAQKMASFEGQTVYLYDFLNTYRMALPPEASFQHKLALVIKKVAHLMPHSKSVAPLPGEVGKLRSASAGSNHPPATIEKEPKKSTSGR